MIRECVSSVHVQLSCTTCLLCRQSIRTARVMLRPCWTRILMHFSSRKHQQSALGNGSIFQSPRRRCLGRWRMSEPQHVRRQSHYSLTGGKHGRKLRGTVSVPGTMGFKPQEAAWTEDLGRYVGEALFAPQSRANLALERLPPKINHDLRS